MFAKYALVNYWFFFVPQKHPLQNLFHSVYSHVIICFYIHFIFSPLHIGCVDIVVFYSFSIFSFRLRLCCDKLFIGAREENLAFSDQMIKCVVKYAISREWVVRGRMQHRPEQYATCAKALTCRFEQLFSLEVLRRLSRSLRV